MSLLQQNQRWNVQHILNSRIRFDSTPDNVLHSEYLI